MIPHNMEGQEKLSVISESHRQKLELELFLRSQGLGFPVIALGSLSGHKCSS